MNSTNPQKEIVTFIADELIGNGELFINAAAIALRKYLGQSILMTGHPSGPVLVLWLNEKASFTVVTTEQAMHAIEETAGEYTDNILGLGSRVRVIVGYREEALAA